MRIKETGMACEGYVIEKRRQFHQIPELSLQEYKTSRAVLEELEKLGITGKIVADTGVLATIHGAKPGRCVALRADMDALGVTERTGAPFASIHKGMMHACGHDAHIAMLLGAAKLLKGMEDELTGEVRLIFEPGEEIAKGANKMIDAGAMQGVDSVFGIHVWADLPAGVFSAEPGSRMASADFFTIEIDGRSCHGSCPHQGVDAIVTGAALVNNLQTVVSRELNPLEPAVLSLGEFIAGEQSNVVAGHAHLSGTTRAFTNEMRDQFPVIMERIIRHTAETFRAKIQLHYNRGSSPVINDPASAALAAGAIEKLFGADALAHFERTPGGENFSEYLRLVPGAFVFLGVRNQDCDAIHPQHSCYYTIDESALIRGAMAHAQYALDFLQQ